MAKGRMFDVTKLRKTIRKKQSTINKNSRKLKSAPKKIVVGWDSKSGSYPEQGKKPVWYIAKIHEYGTEHHPAKHMVGNTIFAHEKEWAKAYRRILNRKIKMGVVPNYFTIAEELGRRMRDDLKDYVYKIDLVDTSRLANSIIIRYKRR